MNKLQLAGLCLVSSLFAVSACGSLGSLGGLAGNIAGPLDQATIADGLREALHVGTERAVAETSRQNGFLGNQLIRIAVPSEVEKMTAALRKIGLGSQVDEFEIAMNRAAEKASAEAVPIFWEAVKGLTIEDARAVLDGGKHAATKLLKQRTSAQLEARFEPIVAATMDEVGVTRLYDSLAGSYNALPFSQKPAVGLGDYVTAKTVDGVFIVLGKEEERIRADPVARTTELLRRVFQ